MTISVSTIEHRLRAAGILTRAVLLRRSQLVITLEDGSSHGLEVLDGRVQHPLSGRWMGVDGVVHWFAYDLKAEVM